MTVIDSDHDLGPRRTRGPKDDRQDAPRSGSGPLGDERLADSDLQASVNTEDLLSKAREGTPEAWEELYRRHRRMLIVLVRSQIPEFAQRSFDAEDVLQAAFSKVWTRLASFQYRGEGSLRRWISTIVFNEFKRKLKEHGREHGPPEEESMSGVMAREPAREGAPSEFLRSHEEEVRLFEAMGRLEEDDRELVSMQFFEGLSLIRIGEILGLHRNMVRKRLTRALERLERALSEEND